MLIECDDNRYSFMLTRVGDGLTDDLLMAEMHAVEHANGKADFATAANEISCAVNDVHNSSVAAARQSAVLFPFDGSAEPPLRRQF